MTPSLFYRDIPLTQGQVAIVDADDYEWLTQWKWFAWWSPSGRCFYAVRSITEPRKGTIRMNRQILGLESGDKRQGDHANHNTLDNRRANLRIATAPENGQNRRTQKNSKSGHKGVSYRPCKRKWRATIKVDGKHVHLGYRETMEECIELYLTASMKHFGEYSCAG